MSIYGRLLSAYVSREAVQEAETEELLGKLFDGAPEQLFASLLGSHRLTREQIEQLRRMIAALDQEG